MKVRLARIQIRDPNAVNRRSVPGFTLFELLVVMGIMGLLAALGLPALRGLSRPNITSAADRQLLDDLALARQTAIARRTTVYVAFAPPDLLWRLTVPKEYTNVMNGLLDSQYRTYALISLRSVGDQPGQSRPQYLTDWRSLPDGIMIATNKFIASTNAVTVLSTDAGLLRIYPFATNNLPFPFPTAGSPNLAVLPCLAFNSHGQLEQLNRSALGDEFIPLAKGSIMPFRDVNGFPLPAPPDVREIPPGNSTNTYNLIQISWLTGRARVIKQEVVQ